jgi:hypothetical protein
VPDGGWDSWEADGGWDSLDCGACCGGLSGCARCVEVLGDELPPARLARLPAVPGFSVCPANALAAMSESTPVITTLPASRRRFARLSLRRAASRPFAVSPGIRSAAMVVV